MSVETQQSPPKVADINMLEEEESECVSQLHLLGTRRKGLQEGAAFQAVRDQDIPRLSAIIFSGYNLNANNEEEGLLPDADSFYDIQDRNRMVRCVRIKAYTPLHLAVVHSNLKVIKFLLSKGADANVRDANSITPLALSAAVQRPDVALLLIRAGANVNVQSVSGRTPLLNAIGNNNLTMVEMLLQAGADPNLEDVKGTTPLLMCLQASRDSQENLVILHTLISGGSIVDKPNKQGATALMLAVGMGRLDAAEILVTAGADINKRDRSGQSCMHLATGTTSALFLLHRGATSDWPDNKGVTPLLKAARVCHVPLMTLFLESDSARPPAVLDFPRVAQVRQQFPAFDQWLHHEFASPRTLKRLCRQIVRKCLSPDHTPDIELLPLPTMVKDFLFGKHLELPFYRHQMQERSILSTVPVLHP